MLCLVLGLLVLPTVSPLVPGVSAGEGVVAFGLVNGGGALPGVAVTGPGFGHGWSGVAGCGRSPLLAEGLLGLPLYPSGVSGGPAAPLAGGVLGSCSLGVRVLCVFVVRAVLALWCVVCVCGARVGGGCGGVCGLHAWACVRCVCGAFGCLSSPFLAWFGGSVWVRGLCVVAPPPPRLWGPNVVPRHPWLGPVGGGVSPGRPLCVPSPLFLFAASLEAVFPWCLARAFPAVVGGGGGGP